MTAGGIRSEHCCCPNCSVDAWFVAQRVRRILNILSICRTHRRYSRSLDAGADLQNTFIAQVATNRAQTCIKLHRLSDAIADAERAITADERFAKAYLRRAQAYELQQEWQAAVRDLTKVQELDDKFPGIGEQLKRAKVELKKSKRIDYYKVSLLGEG